MSYTEENEHAVTCMDIRCAQDKNSYTIYFSEDNFYKCEKKGSIFTYDDYSVVCLDPIEFCKIEENCPENCNFNGECLVDGTCWCNPFYTGDSCENFIGCPSTLELLSLIHI